MWRKWTSRWNLTIQAIEKIGGDVELHISNRATEEQIVTIEKKLGFRLPSDFRTIL